MTRANYACVLVAKSVGFCERVCAEHLLFRRTFTSRDDFRLRRYSREEVASGFALDGRASLIHTHQGTGR